MDGGDKNTKFFHVYGKGEKITNIFVMLEEKCKEITSFEGILSLG